MYASMNFITKRDLINAINEGVMPIVLYNPVQQVPAFTGRVRVEGPWPGTLPPVEEIKATHRDRGHATWSLERRCYVKPRAQVKPWHADVLVADMRVMAVVR